MTSSGTCPLHRCPSTAQGSRDVVPRLGPASPTSPASEPKRRDAPFFGSAAMPQHVGSGLEGRGEGEGGRSCGNGCW